MLVRDRDYEFKNEKTKQQQKKFGGACLLSGVRGLVCTPTDWMYRQQAQPPAAQLSYVPTGLSPITLFQVKQHPY